MYFQNGIQLNVLVTRTAVQNYHMLGGLLGKTLDSRPSRCEFKSHQVRLIPHNMPLIYGTLPVY